jgi:hypothetical protein
MAMASDARGATQRPSSRQEPSSCQTCRAKKLRCNRVQPCSNCTSRELQCIFLVPPPRKKHAVIASQSSSSEELLLRIERLEAALETSRAIQTPVSNTPRSPGYTAFDPNLNDEYGGNKDACERHVVLPELIQTSTATMSAGSNDGPAFRFRIASVQEIIELPQNVPITDQSTLPIPTYKVAMVLYQSYSSILDGMCRILHMPTLRALIESFYMRVAAQSQSQASAIPPGEAALVLSVLAVSAFFTPQLGETATTTRTRVDSADTPAALLSKVLAKNTLRVLDESRRTTGGSIEDIQAYILMSYVDFHHNGSSAPKSRLHIGVAILLSRHLGLHLTDADADVLDSTLTPGARLDKELRRRALWYLASAEW